MRNPLQWYRERKDEKKHQQALKGEASSGHLNPGERDRAFRARKKTPTS